MSESLPKEIVFTSTEALAYRAVAQRQALAVQQLNAAQQDLKAIMEDVSARQQLTVAQIDGKYRLVDDGKTCRMLLNDGPQQVPLRSIPGGKSQDEGGAEGA